MYQPDHIPFFDLFVPNSLSLSRRLADLTKTALKGYQKECLGLLQFAAEGFR